MTYRGGVRTPLTALLTAAALLVPTTAVIGTTASAGATKVAPTTRQVDYTSWDRGAELGTGRAAGVRVARGTLRLDDPAGRRAYAGRTYAFGRWTSPWVAPAFELTELVASWEATTPEGTFVEVEVRGSTGDGRRSSWDVLGRWASGDQELRRTSVGDQGDDLADVSVDTFRTNAADTTFASWRMRVTLNARTGTPLTPKVDAVGAVASRIPATTGVPTSTPRAAGGITLAVPRFSQMIHEGHFPRYGGGGESWCSPTSLAMVLGYYDALPSTTETAGVGTGHRDRVVDHLARMTYDYAYQGTGNWPFNTAYAATRTGIEQAFVTRFRSLVGVERFIGAGIPVITSVTFSNGQLVGAPISSTNGHVLVVVGFTETGDVVVNDPAAASKAEVRRTYDRGQFENAWLMRGSSGGSGGSGGLAYVVRDAAHPLPARRGATSW